MHFRPLESREVEVPNSQSSLDYGNAHDMATFLEQSLLALALKAFSGAPPLDDTYDRENLTVSTDT